MARNAEKAMTALARFRQAQLEGGKVKERRPFLASECNDLPKAEKWRRQIISEVAKKVAQIQNAGLGEFKIRDLNDEINKLLREKRHWEYRIRELGGSDYKRFGPRMLDHEGRAVPGNRGYKYFGAARDLPGVRELFEKEPAPELRKTRGELMKDVDAEYYGYRDEDDGVLVPMEILHKKRAVAEAIHKWRADCQCLPSGDNKVPKDEEDNEPSIYCVNNRQRRTSTTRRLWRKARGAWPSSHTSPFPRKKRWRRLWSAGRRWNFFSGMPVKLCSSKVRKPERCWDCDTRTPPHSPVS
ncbi:pre-mRNA-splicing factor ISY1 homolog isoform X2 [Syngnathus scovelli]|uniref:pre-mRNA-splicing factor ISY1 homolog isoform X2 n=1 Tax=Syngnathus scovelli TaxID=161590 RepID=UPI00210FD3E1|nr:pre-mRNA-splicing factor ISY1 homolog isoform X2 [Syngnathus scovelli]